MAASRPARRLTEISAETVREATDALIGLVEGRLPERFYPSEDRWRMIMTASLARVVQIADSMKRLADPRCQADARILLRSLYEHVVTFLWLAIDPERRAESFYEHTLVHRRRLHKHAAEFGVEDVLSPQQLEEAVDAEALDPTLQLADEVDKYWASRVAGLHEDPADGPRHLLSMSGLYLGIYRVASRTSHPSLESLDACASPEAHHRLVVSNRAAPEDLNYSALAVPLTAIALVVAEQVLGWPDGERVREINDAFVADENESTKNEEAA